MYLAKTFACSSTLLGIELKTNMILRTFNLIAPRPCLRQPHCFKDYPSRPTKLRVVVSLTVLKNTIADLYNRGKGIMENTKNQSLIPRTWLLYIQISIIFDYLNTITENNHNDTQFRPNTLPTQFTILSYRKKKNNITGTKDRCHYQEHLLELTSFSSVPGRGSPSKSHS